jgi:hypothetical protein
MNEIELRQYLENIYPDKNSDEINMLIQECKTNEGAWSIFRKERNEKLVKSDWTQISDYENNISEEKKIEWALYRQQLRDLPNNIDFPGFPIYPINPDGEL